jgi:hypothetical protein
MQNQPVSDAEVIQHVFITVAGGVAYVANSPELVKVHVIDYDELKADFEIAFNRLSPEAQAYYRERENGLPDLSGMELN